MSLSLPVVKFPLLKLPWLCIKDVVKSWDILDIIFFALFSKRTRQIVKHLKIPLNGIKLFLSYQNWIWLDNFFREWHFKNGSEKKSSFDVHRGLSKYPLVLQKDAIPLYTSKTSKSLKSYTEGNEITAVKIAMEFLNEVFKCSVEEVSFIGDDFPESGDIGIKSTVNLDFNQDSTQPYGYAQSQKLNLLLENLEVTGACTFWLRDPEQGFYVDPKCFKCKKLEFCFNSSAWVTREILLQFEVPQLKFENCPFSVQDILSFVSNWFHSQNKKLEYLYIESCGQISLKNFRTAELNPVSFRARNRVPPTDSFEKINFSKGLEIVRHDGLKATIHVQGRAFLFYVCHNQ